MAPKTVGELIDARYVEVRIEEIEKALSRANFDIDRYIEGVKDCLREDMADSVEDWPLNPDRATRRTILYTIEYLWMVAKSLYEEDGIVVPSL
jgi:hypothetical protein